MNMPVSHKTAGSAHILLVEDNLQEVELLKLAFAPYVDWLNFCWVPNVITAVDFLAKRREFVSAPTPDLILIDLHLPILSGFTLLHILSQDRVLNRIRAIILSGSQSMDDVQQCYQEGASLYVVKPRDWDHWTDLATSFARLCGPTLLSATSA
jgi:chemotaxis family two-component system response regulator Rcp1